MGHTHLDDNSVNSCKKLTTKGDNRKACPTDILAESNVDDHYFKCSCENASSKAMHSRTDDECFLELRRTSVYQSSTLHRKFWLGSSKGPKGEGKLDSGSNLIYEKGLDVQNCSQRHAMSRLYGLQKGENDDHIVEESSTMYSNSMVKDKKPETENLIHNMSNLPHYLQQAEKGESFQERALRFGVLDWSLLEKWNRNRGRGQRGFHSPSGSDTSSSFSTLGSSSFSCRSDHSSSAKREMSPSSSFHTYLNSSSVSSTNLHGLSYSSSPTSYQEKYPSCVEALQQHGSKQFIPNAQIKTDYEGKHYEYLDLKFLQRKVVDSHHSKVEVANDTRSSLDKKLSNLVHKVPNHECFSKSGMGNVSGICGSKTGHSSNFVFELPKEQGVSGPATPGFLSAGDRSPETCSEVSLNLEDAPQKLGENSRFGGITGLNQVASLEDDINIHFADCLEELPAARADECNIQTQDPSFRDKCAAFAHRPSPQKVDPNISISTECDGNSIHVDDYGFIFQNSQESIIAKNFVCPVANKLKNVSRNSIHLKTDASDVSFHQSQSAIHNELQPRKKEADVPVKIAAVFSDQHLSERVVTNEFPVAASRNYKNRRAKSFSLNGSTDSAINDNLTAFMTPKSFSVRSDTCSSDSALSNKDGCKKSVVSPLRRWIDPIVKSRERHRVDVSSRTPLQRNSLHHDHDADVLNSKGGIEANKSLRKSLAQGFSRASHITLRNSSVRSTSSDCQAFIASENDTSGKNSQRMSRSRCISPRPKHEKVSEKLSQSALETSNACLSMPAPPARSPILQGLLHFKYKNGFPYFTFSRNESDEVLAAKTWKDNSEGRDFDWMYSFHSGKNTNKNRNKTGWGSWGRKDNHMPDLVANMKVSSSLRPKLNGHGNVEHLVETEFVLFGAKKGNINSIVRTEHAENRSFSPAKAAHSDVSLDMPLSNSSPLSKTSSTMMPEDTVESIVPRDLPPKHSGKKSEMHVPGHPLRQNSGEPYCQSNPTRSISEGRNTIQSTQREPAILNSNVILSSPFSPDLELAAFVIKVPLEWRESVKGVQGEDAASNEFGGWGLKFLAKNLGGSSSETYFDYPMNLPSEFDDDSHCHSLKSSVSPMEFGNISVDNSCLNSERCSFELGPSESPGIYSSSGAQGHTGVTVIIPAGIHSQPSTNSVGPSPLIERWRSGGGCDCGGWDLGCPLTILEKQNLKKNNLSERIVRANQGTLALSLDVVHDGLYLLRFHPQLSALQAFSIGVAMLHSREPLMFSKETQLEKPCSRTSRPPHAKTLSQAISTPQDDIPISVPSNHDIFFASRVPDRPLSPFGRV